MLPVLKGVFKDAVMGKVSMNGLLVFATVVKLLALFLVYQFLFLKAMREIFLQGRAGFLGV